ncbi:DUF4190 domain-containing protein [Streptomyces sp. NPDC028635]|uniref:DUF4190 domain-containing protein n=1 Tax=Streptomyces sp. NPDC028635 TaxID=3154800 RepID=UPI0033D69AA3
MTSHYSSPTASYGTRINGLAIASLVCGVAGVLALSVVFGPLAMVLGVVALRQRSADEGLGFAKAGVFLGAVDLLSYVVLLTAAAFHGDFVSYLGS